MNERFKQLAVKAGATLEKGYIELSDGQLMLSDGIDVNKDSMDLEKFAELLLEECAKRAEAYAYMSPNFTALAEELRSMKGA